MNNRIGRCALLFFLLFIFSIARSEATSSNALKITEVMAGSASSSSEELIELINTGNAAVNLTGWKIKFISSSNVQKEIATLSGIVASGQIITLANYAVGFSPDYTFLPSLLTYNGHLQVLDSAGQEIDKLGWGTALSYESQAIAALSGGKVASRYIDCAGSIIDTDNNADDFFTVTTSTFGSMPATTKTDCAPPEDPKICHGIELSEILPNAVGADEGKEFIEIHNPLAESMSLYGCSLKSSSSSKIYEFSKDAVIAPGHYLALYDTTTGLTLLNSAGGSVTLSTIDSDNEVQYPPALADDISWAFIDGAWQQTNKPTPDAANEKYEENEIISEESKGVSELEPCPEGKYRNPETNRCKTIETDNSSQPCKAGQYRNPETNRCKSILLASTGLASCKPGQYRNPETNRCKSIETVAAITECEEGYERNPETNRCKKVSAVKAAANLDSSENKQPTIHYPILIIFTLFAVGYGVYEFKSELIAKWLAFRKKS